jgi:putative phosphoribosyl transferase
MQFKDRAEAAHLLLKKLLKFKEKNPIVLGIPRGAVPMASIIAKGLGSELGVVLVHKIPSPFNEEFGIGSVGLSGHIHRVSSMGSDEISESYWQTEAERQRSRLEARQQAYGLKDPNYKDRWVIIVDDGIATGVTTLSAVHEVQVFDPKAIILATPVASRESIEMLESMVYEIIVLDVPEHFYAVGQFYKNFTQVEDEEVIQLLRRNQVF